MNLNDQELVAIQEAYDNLRSAPHSHANTVALNRLGKLLRDSAGIKKDFFVYTAKFTTLVHVGASQTVNISIQADSDFLLQAQNFHATAADAAQTISNFTYPLCTVLLTDTGSGRNLMDAAVDVASIFGNGQFPFILPQPRLFTARSNLSVVAANYDAAQDINLRLSFIGTKFFYPG